MPITTRALRAAAVLSMIFIAGGLWARTSSRRSDAWPQGMHVTTAAALRDAMRGANAPVLVVLFAGWCSDCRREIPSLDRIVAAYADTDLRVLAVTLDEDPDGYGPLADPALALSPMRLDPSDQDALVTVLAGLGGHYHRSIPYVALIDHPGAQLRDRWTEGRRLEDVLLRRLFLQETAGRVLIPQHRHSRQAPFLEHP